MTGSEHLRLDQVAILVMEDGREVAVLKGRGEVEVGGGGDREHDSGEEACEGGRVGGPLAEADEGRAERLDQAGGEADDGGERGGEELAALGELAAAQDDPALHAGTEQEERDEL